MMDKCDRDRRTNLIQINYRMRVTLNDGRQMTGQVCGPILSLFLIWRPADAVD